MCSSDLYESQEIPGRDGDLLINTQRRANVKHSYNAIMTNDLIRRFDNFRNALLSIDGYARLEDSIHPDEFYLAYFSDDVEPTIRRERDTVKFAINFIRKPQRFLKAGESPQEFTADSQIVNPTLYASKPLLRVYGVGTVSIDAYEFEITEADGYTDIDCDMMECYKDSYANNCNGNVTFTNYEFPRLDSGVNAIALGTGITKIAITPRWYII